MAAPFWQAGTLYLPGDLVQPITQPPPNNPQVANGNFAGGATGWTFSGAAGYVATGGYGGGAAARLPGNQPDGVAVNNTQLVVPVGGQLTATSMIAQGASSAGRTAGWTEIRWFDGLNTLLQTDKGNVVDDGSGGAWHQSKVTATAPASAAYARAAIHLTSDAGHNDQILGDNLSVSGASAGLPEGLVYKAVQVESGLSGSSEPAWPGILGLQVIDNEVIWEAVTTSRVTWTASPRYVSGTTEPIWPEDIGAMVQDGTINWRAVSRRIEDERCPRTKVVAIVASKVFAVDKDIVKFCATANPLDWTTADDAGYLPTGLQQANSNDMAVLAQYRANLVALNASSFQNWQVDPDPASMAILDQMDGIGSQWQKAAVPVSNDLFYLSQLGVRTIGIANAAENLAAGDVGAPIDLLVQEALRVATANESKVLAAYYPGAGQYWLSFADFPPEDLGIFGDLPNLVAGEEIAPFSYVVAGGVKPYGPISLTSGALPTGLVVNTQGVVSGAPTTAGVYSWTVGVSDSNASTASHPDSSTVVEAPPPPSISGSPPNGQMLVSYSYQFTLAGDFPPLVVEDLGDSIPQGLAISALGLLSGTPLEEFSGAISLRVTDARGVHSDSSFPLLIRGLDHWNASDKAAAVVLSEDDKVAEVVVSSPTTAGGCVRAVQARSTGKFYVEFVWERFNVALSGYAGLLTGTGSLTTAPEAQASMSAGVRQTSQFNIGGTNTASGDPPSQGARVGVAIDLDARRCWIHINGVWKFSQSPTSHPGGLLGAQTPAAPLYPVAFSDDNNTGLSHKIRLVVQGSQMNFRPTGFTPWGGM
ncbi:Ig domain-containing protein [Stenotrophomonas rhizophila]|uniref:Ig domain-containing protein n=1 Tax=Stenotrophomonas rhizophila TaxID=216778 RepID=UPI00215A8FC3|nr:Ig domain-containing protein [Stenotrophomonas rhizophila]